MSNIFSRPLIKLLLPLLALSVFSTQHVHAQSTPGQAYFNDDAYVSYNDFYQELAPYGQWMDDPNYGYVWVPNVDGSFRPYYTNGYWAMTEFGNTWVSNYPWGWACFHYGRWIFDQYYGWIWIPGSVWGPAWVAWRNGGGYYGWAPLGPNYDFNSGDYLCPNDWWVFLPPQYIYSGNYYRYWNGPRGNREWIHNSNFVNNVYVNNNVTYVSGPHQGDIEQFTHQPVHVYHLDNASSRSAYVHNDVIKIFRPAEVKQQSVEGSRPAPPNVISAPQPVNSRPQTVNSHAGSSYRYTPQGNNNVPSGNNSQNKSNDVPLKADKYQYKTDIPTNDVHLQAPPPDQPKENPSVKPQGPQNPEPVHYQPQQNNNPTPASQHVETVRPQQQQSHSQPTPSQRPEPVRHNGGGGGKR